MVVEGMSWFDGQWDEVRSMGGTWREQGRRRLRMRVELQPSRGFDGLTSLSIQLIY